MRLSNITESSKPDLSRLITPDIKKLDNLFKKYNEEIRIVGGAVRDALLGKQPKDVDLATTATPDKMIKIAKNNNIKVIETGLQHGTVTFLLDNEPYEITTLRVDTETDGRHASVDWTKSFKEDARRRDLTYNAMSVDMDGKLHDYFGGLKDLRANSTQFVGNPEERIQEDFLRILRYFRFLSKQPQQKPNKELLETIKRNVNGLKNISGERIWMEMSKMAMYPNFSNAMKAMCSIGIGKMLFMNCDDSVLQDIERIQKETNNPITVLSSLFKNVSDFFRFANKLKIPNEYKNLGEFITNNKNNPKESYAQDILTKKLKPEYVLELAKVINSNNLSKDTKNLINAGAFPVTGQDLINIGMKPGPNIGKTLNILKKEWINNEYRLTKKQLLDKIIRSKET
jgi:tRNA nucleotidyltransferase (CCA-adding enzyme)